MNKIEIMRIRRGIYRYTKQLPAGCYGALYQVLHTRVLDVPDYQWKILVKALTGTDQGLLFTVAETNFALRYEYVCARVEDLYPQLSEPGCVDNPQEDGNADRPRAEGANPQADVVLEKPSAEGDPQRVQHVADLPQHEAPVRSFVSTPKSVDFSSRGRY